MKKTILLALTALTLHFSLHAQLTKNSWLVGGSLGINSTTTTDGGLTSTGTLYTIAPQAGYFFIPRLAAGLDINTSLVHSHYTLSGSSASYDNHSYGFGPFVRYYFLPAEKKVNILAQLSDLYTIQHSPYTDPKTSKSNTFGLAAGPVFFLNPFVAIEWTFGFSWQSSIGADISTTSHTFTTAAGFQVYLPGKHRKA